MMPPLTIYPAIDLKNGQCVRLLHGDMSKDTVYNDDPAAQARLFQDAGYGWLHMVDLDGAFSGTAENRHAVEAILARTESKKQLGGGIRTMAAVEGWLSAGIDRVILGTAAVKAPEFVKQAARAFPGQIAIGIDAKDGLVRTDGWAEESRHTAVDLGKKYEDQGISAIIYTDISRDGALGGVNVEMTTILAEALAIPVIASGGVASTADLAQLAKAHPNIEGVIVGRAIYDGKIDLEDAKLAVARPE